MTSEERASRTAWFWRRSRKYEIKERPKSWHIIGNYRKILQQEESPKDEAKPQTSSKPAARKSMPPPPPPVRSPSTHLSTVPSQTDLRLSETANLPKVRSSQNFSKTTTHQNPEEPRDDEEYGAQNRSGKGHNPNQKNGRESSVVI